MWIDTTRRKANALLRLYAFPYAGGSSHIFNDWAHSLPNFVDVCALELPGRGRRFNEPPQTNISLLVQDIANFLASDIDRSFAFFGHSMGALLAYEVAHCLSEKKNLLPKVLFVSGRGAPDRPPVRDSIADLPLKEFVEKIASINGTPTEILSDPSMQEIFVPILRSDFRLVEEYTFEEREKLTCPLVALGGIYDDASLEDIRGWEGLTSSRFNYHMFAGGHFFIREHKAQVLSIVSRYFDVTTV